MRQNLKTSGLVIALLMAAQPALTDMVGVSQCNQQADDGVFRSGLLTVEEDGTRTFHPVAVNGLTDSIVYNRVAAWDWVTAQGLFPEGTVYANYDGYVCGMPCEECVEPEPEQAAPEEPDPQEPEPEDPEPEDPDVQPTE